MQLQITIEPHAIATAFSFDPQAFLKTLIDLVEVQADEDEREEFRVAFGEAVFGVVQDHGTNALFPVQQLLAQMFRAVNAEIDASVREIEGG